MGNSCTSYSIHVVSDWDVILTRDPNDDYLCKATSFTKMWVNLANEVIDPNEKRSAREVTRILRKQLLPIRCQDQLQGNGISLRFTAWDEELGEVEGLRSKKGIQGMLAGAAFKELSKLPNEERERLSYFPSAEVGIASGKAVIGRVLPIINVQWEDFTSDEAFSLIAFDGLGMLYLAGMPKEQTSMHKPVAGAACQIDLSLLEHYATREPFERYGCIAYFSEDKRPLAIWWCSKCRLVTPGEADWNHCKFLFRSSLVTMVTVRDHLIHVHWYISNTLLFASRQSFPADHPLRRLLKPHTFLATNVNWASTEVLLPVNSLAYRVFAVDSSAWKRLVEDCIKSCKFETFPEQMDKKNLPASIADTLPLRQDGCALWAVIRKYVRDYVGMFYTTNEEVLADECIHQYWAHYESAACWTRYGLPPLGLQSLVDQITHSIFWVTAGHELVGSIVQYFVSPEGLGSKVMAGKCEADTDSHFLSLTLLALTGFTMPMLMDDWSHIHIHSGLAAEQREQMQCVLDDFQAQLRALSNTIDSHNKAADKNATAAGSRRKPFEAFNPKFLECSVSI